MNKLLITAVIIVYATALNWGQSAHAQEGQVQASPVDFRACNFRDGKTMKDLDKVSAEFRKYANKNDFNYAAWTLTPQFHSQVGFDVGWLGAWRSAEDFGVSMERWHSSGREVAAAFEAVIDCGSRHEMALSVPVNAPESTPEDGVLMFYACTLNEGKSSEEAYQAHLKLGAYMRGLGSPAVSWLFYPALGAGPIDFDYYHVVGFYRYSDMGASMDLYANRGGYQQARKVVSPVSSCATPVVFDALSVRAYEER